VTAAQLLPDLKDLGYTLTQKGKDPGAPAAVDSMQALYAKDDGSSKAIQVRVYVFPTVAAAKQQFTTVAAAFKNPPPEVFGTDVKDLDATSPKAGDQQKSYVTDKPDSNGNSAWTDIYQGGPVLVIAQVLDQGSGGAGPMNVRTQIAERIFKNAG
jgi:hypothetical protein